MVEFAYWPGWRVSGVRGLEVVARRLERGPPMWKGRNLGTVMPSFGRALPR